MVPEEGDRVVELRAVLILAKAHGVRCGERAQRRAVDHRRRGLTATPQLDQVQVWDRLALDRRQLVRIAILCQGAGPVNPAGPMRNGRRSSVVCGWTPTVSESRARGSRRGEYRSRPGRSRGPGRRAASPPSGRSVSVPSSARLPIWTGTLVNEGSGSMEAGPLPSRTRSPANAATRSGCERVRSDGDDVGPVVQLAAVCDGKDNNEVPSAGCKPLIVADEQAGRRDRRRLQIKRRRQPVLDPAAPAVVGMDQERRGRQGGRVGGVEAEVVVEHPNGAIRGDRAREAPVRPDGVQGARPGQVGGVRGWCGRTTRRQPRTVLRFVPHPWRAGGVAGRLRPARLSWAACPHCLPQGYSLDWGAPGPPPSWAVRPGDSGRTQIPSG